jgi:hypothetical protein
LKVKTPLDETAMRPLQLTSCLFATLVLHAYYRRCAAYHHAFLLVTVFSLLFHTTHDRTIAVLDKWTAHLAFCMTLCDVPRAIDIAPWLVLFPIAVAALWCMEFVYTRRRDELHVGLHLVSVVGVHCFLYWLYGDRASSFVVEV